MDNRWKCIAKENGIHPSTYRKRVRDLGWSPERAATTQANKKFSEKRTDYDYKQLAIENGIDESTYRKRVDRGGWSPQKAATTLQETREDRHWIKLAERNGITRKAYTHRVDEMFWHPEKAATTPLMTKDEVLRIAHKYGREYWETKNQMDFNNKNNLYTITPQHVEIGFENGINKRTIENRVYSLGWTVHEAITKPLKRAHDDGIEDYSEHLQIAKNNGISKRTFDYRLKSGWLLKESATVKPCHANGKPKRSDKEWMDLALKNGINPNTYMSRVDVLHWSKEDAATITALPPGQFLNEERRMAALEGARIFGEGLMGGG